MAGASERQTAGRTSAGTEQRKTTQKKNSRTGSRQTGSSRSASGKSNGSGKSNAAGNSRGARQNGTEQSHADSFLSREITILAVFAVCVLLFLSNLGLCGEAGQAVHGVMCGVFGLLGYIFPIYLFVAVLFYLSNRENGKAIVKLAVSAGLFLVFCGLIGLLTTRGFDKSVTVAEYYAASVEEPGGGAAGGLFLKILCPALGKIGAYVVIILLATIGIVFVTERSVLQPISRGGRKMYDTAREDAARRRELHAARVEEKRRYRLEQKVSGVALDTKVGSGLPEKDLEEEIVRVMAEEPEDRSAGNTAGNTADKAAGRASDQPADNTARGGSEKERRPICITGLGFEKQERKDTAENVPAENVSAEEEKLPEEKDEIPLVLPSDDILLARKDTRTLAELEALDSLHSNVFSRTRDQAIWKDAEKEEKEEEKEPERFSVETGVQMHLRDLQKPEELPPAEPEFHEPLRLTEIQKSSPAEEESEDVKRVVTASGKIVEVDIDPDDDPLARKRIERRLAERAAGAKGASEEGAVGQEARGSRGDTVKLAGAAGGGRYAKPEPNLKEERLRAEAKEYGSKPDTDGFSEKQCRSKSGTAVPLTVIPEKKLPPKPYVMPPYHLLKAGDNTRKNSDRELRETARKLETTLQNFGVGVTVTNISCGPSVTRYELQPEQGVRVSKIVGLADDIKLNLAAADIRIEAPIPGKASVGIEVPNKENSIVFLRDILESPAFTGHPSKLAFAVGRDISGEVVVTDLAKMPHLLIAGATGSGKSVCINTLIMSVLYKAKPEEVRLIMVDPKVVELSVYNGIPHLMIPVVTDPKKAAGALNWAVAEMTDRYRKFADWNVRDLKGYNEKIREEAEKNGETVQALPQIVIIVDELADLMMVCPGDVEDAICRLAQMARAAGIHLVIATQRPSVNVITGLIKANVPSRIAFSVSSGVDSRTIIDMNGAEKLLGKGDMLFYPSGYQKPVRVQGAFVSDPEVAAVVDFVSKNNQTQTYDSAVEARMASLDNGDGSGNNGGQGSERDDYFVEAGRFIIEKQKASIGMLQRVFKIGFNRAARIMDQLAEAGVVSEDAGTKAREILMDMNQYEQLLQEMGLS